MRFDEILYNYDVIDALDAMGFDECTPIQEQAIPIISDGYDLIAVAQTGTGKTAAYLLPVIDRLSDGGYPDDAINCVVMAPTRELAQQIDQQMQGFAYFLPISSIPVYGGTDGYGYEQQRKSLKAGADVVIATPGRLLAHLSMGYVDLSKVSFFILDEADRMLDMGFYDDIMQIASHLPKDCQTLMFSATMPPKIQQLANSILHDPKEIKLAVSKPAEKIMQSKVVCYETQKIPILADILSKGGYKKVIVFTSRKSKVRELASALRKKHLNTASMSSDLDQTAREQVILDFKAGKKDIIVATDILSRGIDIDDISLVVNFDVPGEAEDYVHRIGRTARADNDGRAITFVCESDAFKMKQIEKFLEKDIDSEEIGSEYGELPKYEEMGVRKRKSSNRHGKKNSNKKNTPSESVAKKHGDKQVNKHGDKQVNKQSGKQDNNPSNKRHHRTRHKKPATKTNANTQQ